MVTLYWALEYTKVLLAYAFIMFVWPCVIFRSYLRGKSRTFLFSFCVTTQIVIINTMVLVPGLFHLLNVWVIRVLFWGIFIWSISRSIPFGDSQKRAFKHLMTGTYGRKAFLYDVLSGIKRGVRWLWRGFCGLMHSHWLEYGLLGVVVIYGMIYFSYGAFQDYSYGFGDLYVHNEWIYGLTQGKIFSEGVYPEAMHCFIYMMHIIFGVRIYSCLLFLQPVHVGVFLVSAYVLLKEIFHWRYTPIFVLAMFLTVDVLCINEVYGMSRLQWTIPQEFGLHTQFLCAVFLARYLHSTQRVMRKRKMRLTKGYWDENLLVFMMSLAASLAIHFYPTIMAFFLCVCVVLVSLRRLFCRERFWPLVIAVICGFAIAVIPIAGALASGIPFQKSIGWAVSVIDGTESESGQAYVPEISGDSINVILHDSNLENAQEEAQSSEDMESGFKEPEPFTVRLSRLYETFKMKLRVFYTAGYVELYREERAEWIVGATLLSAALWAVCRLTAMLARLCVKKRRINTAYFDMYLAIGFASVFFMMIYAAEALGLPPLIAGSRLCTSEQIYILAVMAVPVDLIFTSLRLIIHDGVMQLASVCTVAGIYVGTILTGNFHSYLYYELTRYNSAVMATYSITASLPKGTYTIISPVDELYQVVQYGLHEELIELINRSSDEDYFIPTEYVFIFVEKHPLTYAQNHFFSGPKWLAWEKYVDYYMSFKSQCPEVAASEITQELADVPIRSIMSHSGSYADPWTRTLIESKAYAWCQDFAEMYPNEMQVYYEDDDFVCYYFKQNVNMLYRLGIYE